MNDKIMNAHNVEIGIIYMTPDQYSVSLLGNLAKYLYRGCYMPAHGYEFECSTQYLTSERSEQVRYRVEHEKIKFVSTSGHVIFCLLYRHR